MEHIFDYHKQRMESIAPVFQLTKNLGKQKWKDFGIKAGDDDIKLNLIMIVLEIIYTYEIAGEKCSDDEIAEILSEIPKEYGLIKGKEHEFVQFIRDTFTMDGRGESLMNTRIIDPVSGTRSECFVSFIQTSYKEGKTFYKLSRVGMNFILSTSEVYENLMFSVEQIKIKEEIKKRNYDSALSQMQRIRAILLNYKETIKVTRRAISKDITGYAEQEYRAIREGINETLSNAHENFDDQLKVLKEQREQFIQNNMKYEDMPDDLKKQIKLIDELKESISKCNALTAEVLADISNMSIDYIETARNYATIHSANRISIEHDIMTEVAKNPDLLGDIWKLFRPMFLKRPEKSFNPYMCYGEQMVMRDEGPEERPVIVLDPEEYMRLEQEKRDETARKYMEIMNQILLLAKQENGVSIKDMEKLTKKSTSFRNAFCQNLGIMREIVLFFQRSDIRHVSRDIKESSNTYRKDTAFGSYIELMKTSDEFKNAEILNVVRQDGEVLFDSIYDERDGRTHPVRCSDIRIYLKEKKE